MAREPNVKPDTNPSFLLDKFLRIEREGNALNIYDLSNKDCEYGVVLDLPIYLVAAVRDALKKFDSRENKDE